MSTRDLSAICCLETRKAHNLLDLAQNFAHKVERAAQVYSSAVHIAIKMFRRKEVLREKASLSLSSRIFSLSDLSGPGFPSAKRILLKVFNGTVQKPSKASAFLLNPSCRHSAQRSNGIKITTQRESRSHQTIEVRSSDSDRRSVHVWFSFDTSFG